MIEYHSVKVSLSDSQLDKLKSATKNVKGVTLKLSLDIIGTDETNFPCNVLWTDRKVASFCKAFVNNSSRVIELSKTEKSKLLDH